MAEQKASKQTAVCVSVCCIAFARLICEVSKRPKEGQKASRQRGQSAIFQV
nr:MAG TPA: hypothetical protein [Caudoviricetes sp.]